MNLPKEKQSLTSLNYKIVNIESYLHNVDRDMNVLADQHAMWKDQKQEWQHSAIRLIQNAEEKVKNELNAIYKQIKSRDQRSKQAIERLNSKILVIHEIQNYCGNLINELHNRISQIQQILGK